VSGTYPMFGCSECEGMYAASAALIVTNLQTMQAASVASWMIN